MSARAVILVGGTLLAMVAAVALLDGPLKRWVPSCSDVTVGFCVRRQ